MEDIRYRKTSLAIDLSEEDLDDH